MTPALRAFVGAFRSATFRSASAPGVVSDPTLMAARDAAESARFEARDLAHLGRYEHAPLLLPPVALDELCGIAASAAGCPVALCAQSLLRLRAGDYTLSADDAARTERFGRDEPFLDLTLDLSPSATGEAEVVFTHGTVACFTVTQRPGELGLAERTTSNGRYDRYLTHRVGARVVTRLRLLLSLPVSSDAERTQASELDRVER